MPLPSKGDIAVRIIFTIWHNSIIVTSLNSFDFTHGHRFGSTKVKINLIYDVEFLRIIYNYLSIVNFV